MKTRFAIVELADREDHAQEITMIVTQHETAEEAEKDARALQSETGDGVEYAFIALHFPE